MVLEIHPLGDYSDDMQVKVHLTPNEYLFIISTHGTEFPGFRLHPIDAVGRMLVVRTDPSMTAQRVYNTLRILFAKNVIKFAHKYLRSAMPEGVNRKETLIPDYLRKHRVTPEGRRRRK